MADLDLFRNFSKSSSIRDDESLFNIVYRFIKKNQFISLCKNGKK